MTVGANAPAASADTQPPAGVPPTVSADALPTVQINGVVWAQVTVGNTVYATGNFTSARPAGSPAGTNETPRKNLLAYDITTGNLITSFDHALNGQGRAITASPNGTTLYVGGDFTQVDGEVHNRIAAFDLTNGSLKSSFTAGTSSTVQALAATDSSVYAGGSFVSAGTVSRGRLAQFTSSGALTGWAPSANSSVLSMVITPDGSKVVFGGYFTAVNNLTYHALGAADAATGAPVPWASQSDTYTIRNDQGGSAAGINSLATDGTKIYLTGYNAFRRGVPGMIEGRAAISPVDGAVVWLNDCHGDSYSVFPINGVVYSTGHAHDCSMMGTFPEAGTSGLPSHHHALAERTDWTGARNGPPTNGYASFQGIPSSTQLNWYPDFAIGTFTGQNQAGWSVTGNSDYIAIGGEFPKVNGVAQQGLVRFALSSHAPNKSGPENYPTLFPMSASAANASGVSTITFPATWDADNVTLTYTLYRDGVPTPVATKAVDSQFWKRPTVTLTDSGLAPSTSHFYKLYVSDPFGNQIGPYTRLLDNASSAITYAGTWTHQNPRGFGSYGNTASYTSVNGASATLRFVGTGIGVVVERAPSHGKMAVSVDGAAAQIVETSIASGRQAQQRVFQVKGLPEGVHTIKVSKVDKSYLVLDGFQVISEAGKNIVLPDGKTIGTGAIFPINQTGAPTTYTGTWTRGVNATRGDLAKDIQYTADPRATVTFTFYGTGTDILGPKASDHGTASVTLDGVAKGTISQKATSYRAQQVIYRVRGLPAGKHTVTLKFATGKYISVDGYMVIA